MFVNGDCTRNYLSKINVGARKHLKKPHKAQQTTKDDKSRHTITHTWGLPTVRKRLTNSNPRCTGVVDTAIELKWKEMFCCKGEKTKHHAPNDKI